MMFLFYARMFFVCRSFFFYLNASFSPILERSLNRRFSHTRFSNRNFSNERWDSTTVGGTFISTPSSPVTNTRTLNRRPILAIPAFFPRAGSKGWRGSASESAKAVEKVFLSTNPRITHDVGSDVPPGRRHRITPSFRKSLCKSVSRLSRTNLLAVSITIDLKTVVVADDVFSLGPKGSDVKTVYIRHRVHYNCFCGQLTSDFDHRRRNTCIVWVSFWNSFPNKPAQM